MNKEMQKLRDGLDAAGVKWEDNSDGRFGLFIYRTKFMNKNGEMCSVIYGEGVSYGYQAGLLEVMPPLQRDDEYDDDVQGWLTADEILNAWVENKETIEARCPLCGKLLERIETISADVDDTTLDYRCDIENHWCDNCKASFEVEAYYEYQPAFYGKITRWH